MSSAPTTQDDAQRNPYEPPRANVDLPAASAAPATFADGPSGIGGWLLLPLLGLALSPLRVMADSVTTFGPLFENDMAGWNNLFAGGPAVAALVVFEVLANLALIIYPWVVLTYFLRKKRVVPRLMIVWFIAIPAIFLIDATALHFAAPDVSDWGSSTRDIVRGVVAAAIWIPYFLLSVRVRNTFVH